MFLGLPFWIVLGIAAYFGRKVGLKVFERTESRPLGVATFLLICIAPWIDAIPGVFYYGHWQRHHPAYAVYERPKVEGFLYNGLANPMSSTAYDFVPGWGAPYQFIEYRREDVPEWKGPGSYLQFSRVPAQDADCVATPRAEYLGYTSANEPIKSSKLYCLIATYSTEPRSKYEFTTCRESKIGRFESQGYVLLHGEPRKTRQINRSWLFPIYGSCQLIRDIRTGHVIAEAWSSYYRPLLAGMLTVWPLFEPTSRANKAWFNAHALTDVLVPANPATFE